jgi:hypothetical protein
MLWLTLRDDTPAAIPAGRPVDVTLPHDASDARSTFEAGRAAAHECRTPEGYALLVWDGDDADALKKLAAGLGYRRDPVNAVPEQLGMFARLDRLAAPEALFCAGFALEISRRYPVVMQGGCGMVSALLIADRIVGRDALPMDPRRITFCTDSATAETHRELILELFGAMDFSPRALYCEGVPG